MLSIVGNPSPPAVCASIVARFLCPVKGWRIYEDRSACLGTPTSRYMPKALIRRLLGEDLCVGVDRHPHTPGREPNVPGPFELG